jgi:hypothetical protein
VIFPEETYDFGVREAVTEIASKAGPYEAIVSDAPNVVAFYLARLSRPDITVLSLSGAVAPRDRASWLIVQREHLTFENRDTVARVQRELTPWCDFYAAGALAAQVYRIPGSR